MKFLDLAHEVMAQRERDGVRGLDREWSRFNCHVQNAPFASDDIKVIGPPAVRAWLRIMAQKRALGYGPERPLSRQTIARCRSLVSAVFVEGVEREIIEMNPCDAVKDRKRVDESDTKEKWGYLTLEEQRTFADCESIPKADRLMVAFAVHTGLRQGEQHHLELADLVTDGPDPHVVVRYGSRSKTGKKLPPKSGKRRTVPLFGVGLEVAREWLALLPTYCPDNAQGLVFPSPRGRIRHQGKPLGTTGQLKAYLAEVDITRRIRWHDLRHTCATNLVTGVLGRRWTIEEVQVVMGHSSITITQRYAHLGEDAIKRAARETEAACLGRDTSHGQDTALVELPKTAIEVDNDDAPVGLWGQFMSRVKRMREGMVAA